MTALPANLEAIPIDAGVSREGLTARMLRSGRILVGGGLLLLVVILCVGSLPWTLAAGDPAKKINPHPLYYDNQNPVEARRKPSNTAAAKWFGMDFAGRSMLGRCLLGGAISLAIGAAAATISVVLGVGVGLLAGYRGGWIDAVLMRSVDVLYGLPYILLVILFKIAFEPFFAQKLGSSRAANLIVLFLAIGLVSWLTMARVVRGQVLALRAQPFIEACRASGLTDWRIFFRHLLPNLIGPVLVYASLTIPQAILQESFLSFLGIGVQAPMPTWGSLASEGLTQALNTVTSRWWMLLFPCTLLAITLLSLNFLGDGLRDIFDPRREAAKI